jgi:hypothetical protein
LPTSPARIFCGQRSMGVQGVGGYENSPGGPDPSWREGASIVLVIVIVIVTIVGAIWSLRKLMLYWGL